MYIISRTKIKRVGVLIYAKDGDTLQTISQAFPNYMKKDIHPAYFEKAKVTCACGNSFIVGATKERIEIETCSACHPFYTGKEKTLDKVGQVQKFRKRVAQKKVKKA